MANIEQDLQAIMDARYGKDVRQSIHDAIKDINDQEEGHVEVIEGYTEDAEAWAKGTKGGTPVESTDPTYHNNAKYYSDSIGETALISEEYAKGTKNGTPVVDGETGYHDNSKYYSEQASGSAQAALEQAQIAVQAAQSITGALKPKGTVTFANLPSVATADTGDMYNISTDFTTTSDFEEGAGVDYTKGTNVYLTSNGKWDVLAGLPIQYIGTRAEINAAVTAGIITEGMMIYCTDEEGPIDITALMVAYDNTSSGLSATSAQGAIDELKSELPKLYRTVTADGIKTRGELVGELFNGIPLSSFTYKSYIDCGTYGQFNCETISGTYVAFSSTRALSSGIRVRSIQSPNLYYEIAASLSGTVGGDVSATVETNGVTYSLYL